MVRKRLAQILLLLFLMQNTQLGEFARLPLLISHFMQHRQQFPATTISGFIKMHYLDQTVIDADYAQDMQLPFKTPVNYCLGIPMMMPHEIISPKDLRFLERQVNQRYHFDQIPLVPAVTIFQPPKTAIVI